MSKANQDWDTDDTDDGSRENGQLPQRQPQQPVKTAATVAPVQADELPRHTTVKILEVAEPELVLPTDFQGALTVVHKLEGELEAARRGPFRTRGEVNAANAKCLPIKKNLERAQKHFFDLQQGNPHVAINADHLAATATGKLERPGGVVEELKRLVEFRDSGRKPIFPSLREVGNPLALSPFERLIGEPSFQAIAAKFNERFVIYKTAVLEADDLLNPHDAIEVLRMALANATDIAEIKKLNEQITAASGAIDDSETSISGTKAALRKIYGPVKDLLFDALAEARGLLSSYRDEAILAEASFFSEFGLDREQTSLSRIHEAALAKIEAEIASRAGSVGQAYVARQIPGVKESDLELIFGLTFTY